LFSLYRDRVLIELQVKDSRGNVIRHQLGEGKHRLGKSVHSDIVLMDPHASRYHADLIVTENGIYLIDANSTNGIWIDQKRVQSKVLLKAGDSFSIAHLSLTLVKALHYFALKKGKQYSEREIDFNHANPGRHNVLTLPKGVKGRTKRQMNSQSAHQ